jgi:guanylate kinase
VISGPGGVGKGTVVNELMAMHPTDLWLSRSWTTRERREGEDPDAYVFTTTAEFGAQVEAGGFLEYAEFLGNYYGTPTPKPPKDRDLILEIDVQGARQVLEVVDSPLLIFLQAPSSEEQRARLERRGDPPEKVQQRLSKAAEEASAGAELGATVLINNDVADTAEAIYDVIRKRRS